MNERRAKVSVNLLFANSYSTNGRQARFKSRLNAFRKPPPSLTLATAQSRVLDCSSGVYDRF